MKNIIKALKIWWYGRGQYVILDPTDNTITISNGIFRHMQLTDGLENNTVFGFMHARRYCFCVNPKLEQESVVSELRYNTRTKTTGFSALCPTVARIMWDYNLDGKKQIRLNVGVAKVGSMYYYIIEKPYGTERD